MNKPDCVFCRILRGELPCQAVYEDDATLAFLDIGPIIKGHTLVIPKIHVERITDVPAEALGRVMQTVQRVAGALFRGLGADGVNVHQTNGAAAGQTVPHVHFHVIPRFEGDGHSWNWRAGAYSGGAEMAEFARRIRGGLQSSDLQKE
ncbi:MAG: HIT family protein [Kiritimatiellae bacterium]|nr:HIT family protein [Kiritimatiellia bacterium]MDW8458858.1 HIT family protein [Verrucomicrobiota bacterium]